MFDLDQYGMASHTAFAPVAGAAAAPSASPAKGKRGNDSADNGGGEGCPDKETPKKVRKIFDVVTERATLRTESVRLASTVEKALGKVTELMKSALTNFEQKKTR